MAKVIVICKYCKSERVIFSGKQSGKQRCKCKNCNRSFQLEYSYNAYKEGVKDRIIPMAHNGSGIRDTARVLGINKNTVIAHIREKNQCSRGKRKILV